MRSIVGLGLAVMLAASWMPHAGAAEADWEAFLKRMAPYEETNDLSRQLADHIENGDDEGIVALAEMVRQDLPERYRSLVADGLTLDPGAKDEDAYEAWAGQVAATGAFPDDKSARVALDNLGSCELAGLLLRNVILHVAEGHPYQTDSGRLQIHGTRSDALYALSYARCQLLTRQSWAPAAIGYHPQACRPDKGEGCPTFVER